METFEDSQEIEVNHPPFANQAWAAVSEHPDLGSKELLYERGIRRARKSRILSRDEEFRLASQLCANRRAFEVLLASLPETARAAGLARLDPARRDPCGRSICEVEACYLEMAALCDEAPGAIARETIEEAGRLVREILSTRDLLISANIGFVVRTARQFLGRRMPIEDLVQEGMSGLITAVDQYDPERGRVTTYARFWIERSIKRALLNQPHTVRWPVRLGSEIGSMLQSSRELEAQLGRQPSTSELANKLGVKERKVEELQAVLKEPVALETFGEESGMIGPLARIADPNAEDPLDAVERKERIKSLAEALKQLNARERKVLGRRFGMNGYGVPETLQEIGEVIGVSRERTRKIELLALRKLRRILCPELNLPQPRARVASGARSRRAQRPQDDRWDNRQC